MNIIPSHNVNKARAAQILGLQVYDTALPQPWLDAVSEALELKYSKNMYHCILAGTVWCYDNSLIGYPYALTKKVYDLLRDDCLTPATMAREDQPSTLDIEGDEDE
jgi:hypothetical protein